MFLKRASASESDVLDQVVGITGLGWTISLLGYLGTVIGYGNQFVARLAIDPQALLYLGGALFVATFGLDRFQSRLSNGER